jgi:hypothetical protein
MFLSKSKCWYLNILLHFLKRVVPLKQGYCFNKMFLFIRNFIKRIDLSSGVILTNFLQTSNVHCWGIGAITTNRYP